METAQSTESRSKTSEANILLKTLIAFKKGNFSVGMRVDQIGVVGKIADTLNDILNSTKGWSASTGQS